MSTKYFHWDGGIAGNMAGFNYSDGGPVEFQAQGMPMLCVQAWHNVPQGARNQIINRLAAAGWVEGEQSKPD